MSAGVGLFRIGVQKTGEPILCSKDLHLRFRGPSFLGKELSFPKDFMKVYKIPHNIHVKWPWGPAS